jgi:hypothetical protein
VSPPVDRPCEGHRSSPSLEVEVPHESQALLGSQPERGRKRNTRSPHPHDEAFGVNEPDLAALRIDRRPSFLGEGHREQVGDAKARFPGSVKEEAPGIEPCARNARGSNEACMAQ